MSVSARERDRLAVCCPPLGTCATVHVRIGAAFPTLHGKCKLPMGRAHTLSITFQSREVPLPQVIDLTTVSVRFAIAMDKLIPAQSPRVGHAAGDQRLSLNWHNHWEALRSKWED